MAARVASSATSGGRRSVSRFSSRKNRGSAAASAASPTLSTPIPGISRSRETVIAPSQTSLILPAAVRRLSAGSAQLHDIEAGDDTVMNRIGALIGLDGAVGLLGAQPGGDHITGDRHDSQRVVRGAGESADEAGVGPAGVLA